VGNVGNAGNTHITERDADTHTTESAGVDTRIGDAGNTERNVVETDTQDNMSEDEEATYIGTNEGKEMAMQDSTRETPEIHETHGTEEHVPETYEEPTAHDEQIIEEMNTANFQHAPETESEEGQIANDDNIVTTHGYNLWPRPTKRHDRLNLMQVTQQSTWADNAKPHMHILMTQMSVKAGIKKFGKRGDDAVKRIATDTPQKGNGANT